MVQNWTADTFAPGHVAQTDLQNIENNFAVLKSHFSGAGAPGNTVAGMTWFDTAQKVLKTRNEADGEWFGLFHGDEDQKILVYRNAAMDGYARDIGVTDKVVALKGVGTYATGGATAGSWTMTGFTRDAHTHPIPHTQTLANGASFGNLALLHGPCSADSGSIQSYTLAGGAGTFDSITAITGQPSNANSGAQSGSGISHNGADRLAAAVCILIYLDLE